MSRVLQIAWREFTATVLTKAFLLGLLMVPAMIGLVAVLVPWMVKQEQSAVFEGRVLLIDPTGALEAPLRAALSPEAFAARRAQTAERLSELAPAGTPGLPKDASTAMGDAPVPRISIETLRADASLDEAKAALRGPSPKAFALVVVAAEALQAKDASPYALYVGEAVEDRALDALRDGIGRGLVDARLAKRGLEAADIRALMRVPRVAPQRLDVDAGGGELVARLLPLAFMALLFGTVLTGGQMLMTSTIEEKSSRVVELLLAAVSPMQLMAGKILGQGAVALLLMLVYGSLGLAGLAAFAALGLISLGQIVLLLAYFLIAYVTIAAVMAAIGAAVNELREAQALLVPVMLSLSLPMMLNMPISRDPNGVLATVLSFVPGVSPMVMVLRLASSTPPPHWQVALSLVVGVLGVIVAVWLAGKVFRIGLLMYGKPPDLRTLWRWVRMA